MKGATAEPENTHEGYNTIIKELGDHSVPNGWIQRPKRNAVPGTPPGPPVQWDKAEDPDDVQPGYGYVPADTAHHEDIFYYHSDHLGSTSYITDAKANVAQFDAYLPYGELLVDEHSSTEELPYKSTARNLTRRRGCITMVQDIWTRRRACGTGLTHWRRSIRVLVGMYIV